MRNHVLPPAASQTYLMVPPNMASGLNRHREGGDAMSGEAKSGVPSKSTATSDTSRRAPEQRSGGTDLLSSGAGGPPVRRGADVPGRLVPVRPRPAIRSIRATAP